MPMLRIGEWVRFDGDEHQVVALAGTSVRLQSRSGAAQVILLPFLLAAPDFELVDGPATPVVEPFGLLDSLPDDVAERARWWQRHVVEVMTGLPSGAEPRSLPRPGFDPAISTLAQREQAKAEELTAAGRPVSARTVRRMRVRYAEQGVWGLVDQRAIRTRDIVGRADPRLVTAIRAELDAQTHASTGTRDRLMLQVVAALAAEHGGAVVPVPARSAFYELIAALSVGRHSFGAATTRRSLANRPDGPFTPTAATRPGQLVQIDSTVLDVMVVLDSGVLGRPDLTMVIDVATRTIAAAVLRPSGTKAVDAALLLARMLVPEPMRPGWSTALRMSASRLPHARLVGVDARLELAAAKPVIVPETIVIDHGRVFVSEVFTRACANLGISIQPARKGTPTDKPIVERQFSSINTLFCQHVAGYTGANVTRRGDRVADEAVWSLAELQDLLDEWIVAGWQRRPHEGLLDPHVPGRAISPNDAYAALVATAGYLPMTLSGEDYLELLPVEWRQINEYGIRIEHRTYDSPDLAPWRRQHSGRTERGGRWEVHYDPYDLSHVFVRTPNGWVTASWTHLPMISAPFADFTWRHARRLAASRGLPDDNETEVARVLDELLTRAAIGPAPDRASARITARTRAARRRLPDAQIIELPTPLNGEEQASAEVIPFGIFDADAEAERWP
ncbi:Mu transposase C-terminal domain-containing protein [Micromonospora sp. WMMD961]|uniref:Mu transposase C-terminal domain-containing protein n=1 Tax=Micromonospora sp. WMMD961 TaxID=3016100 RepID=UPI002417CE6B|nr:Mu transposase C-terminal domain-containing protein [Micromonospora sp. WMMD961]MDG4780379.1 Mu transposase C-terminal domain-containing protein [Micromonospora sp. WMMD961]